MLSDYKLQFYLTSKEGKIVWKALMTDERFRGYDGYGDTPLEAVQNCIINIAEQDQNWEIYAEVANEF